MPAQKMRCSGTWTNVRLPEMPLDFEVMFQSAPHTNYSDPTITVKGQKLQTVDKFTHLGSTQSRNVFINNKVGARIAKASTAFGRLRKNVWE